jgi:hypothetical protein
VGELVARAVEEETFLIFPDEIHAALLRRRAADLNAYLKQRLSGES